MKGRYTVVILKMKGQLYLADSPDRSSIIWSVMATVSDASDSAIMRIRVKHEVIRLTVRCLVDDGLMYKCQRVADAIVNYEIGELLERATGQILNEEIGVCVDI